LHCKAITDKLAGIGMIVGVQLIGRLLDLHLKSSSGESKPERRLPFLIFGSGLVCLGVLAFGWTIRFHVHWIVPIIFTAMIGFGYLATAISATSYVLDVFGNHTAAAIGGTSVMRNSAAALLPLAGPALTDRLGYGWGYSVLCLIGLIAVPIGLTLIYFGERLRKLDRSVAEAHGVT
jgi:MFS family permease